MNIINTIKSYFTDLNPKNLLIEGLKTIAMLAISLLFAIVIIAISCKGEYEAIKVFLLAPFEDSYAFCCILKEAIPLMFTGVAVCIMTRAGQFNMFVEGGFFVGAFVAAVLAPELSYEGCTIFVPILCVLIGTVVAMVIGYIPAKLKSGLGVDEFVSSLMLNYIVLWIVLYLINNVWGDPDMTNVTKYLEDYARLPYLSEDNELSSGFLIAILVCVIGALFLYKTKFGYEIRLTGNNQKFAEYSGIKTSKVVTYSQVIGSGLAGLGGGVFLLGNYYRFSWKSLPNYGFDGFVIAIMTNNNPIFVPLASLFIAYLRAGAHEMSRQTSVQNEVVYIIQGMIIILFGAKFLVDLKLKKRKEAK